MGNRQRLDTEEGRDGMPATTSADPDVDEDVVQFGGRIPASLRRRARVAAATQDLSAQDILRRALEDYLERHGF